jgi:hypothetical protein
MARDIRVELTEFDLIATYGGGAYIDIETPDGKAIDTVNVYDYGKGEPTVACTEEAVRKAATEHLRDDYGDLAEHVLPYL